MADFLYNISKIKFNSKNLHSMNITVIVNTNTLLKTIMTTLFLLSFTVLNFGQTAPHGLLASNDLSPKGIVEEEWSFFYDEENEIYYIDFETISVNLTAVKVVSSTGKEVISDNVEDLPVNTIYELDCSNLAKGKIYG